MKTNELLKKLSLNKKTIADLNSKEMKDLHGGGEITTECRVTDYCPPSQIIVLSCVVCE